MSVFQYVQLSSDFLSELTEMVIRGESTVILASIYGGKSYTMSSLATRLEQAGVNPIVKFRPHDKSLLMTEAELGHQIRQAVVDAAPGFAPRQSLEDDLLSPLEHLCDHLNQRVVLLASNLDSVIDSVARRFLQSVRILIQAGKLVVVLTGESYFRNLIYGPNSELEVSNIFVLQQYDLDQFREKFEEYAPPFNARFTAEHDAVLKLWELTGRNVYLLKFALLFCLEYRVGSGLPDDVPIEIEQVLNALKATAIPASVGAHVFRRATQVIEADAASLRDLENLISEQSVYVSPRDPGRPAPCTLELAGVATRQNGILKFSSPWMEQLVRGYYDKRRLGDLYARSGRWKEAFEKYDSLPPMDTKRPISVDDRSEVAFSVSALSATLHSAAATGVDAVTKLFIQGCGYLLGCRHIYFWQKSGTDWKLEIASELTADLEERLRTQLADALPDNNGLLQLLAPFDRRGVAAALPMLDLDQKGYLFAGDFDLGTVLAGERMKLLQDLVEHFIDAYTHAITVGRACERLDMRNKHIKIIDSIFESLGGEVRNVGETLRHAGSGLRDIGYRRILFCLVDPTGQFIQVAHANPPLIDPPHKCRIIGA